jgi:hypothetical protein
MNAKKVNNIFWQIIDLLLQSPKLRSHFSALVKDLLLKINKNLFKTKDKY